MNTGENNKLIEIFSRVNLSDLPAMSEHIEEIRALGNDPQSTLSDMVKVVMKDYGLTVKILREANSAYYAGKHAVTTMSAAASKLGYDSVLERSLDVPALEDFIQAGLEEGDVLAFTTKAFLGARLAMTIAVEKKINVIPEEAYMCGLLHHLGKGIVLLYLPDLHREVVEHRSAGFSEDESAWEILNGLTYSHVGMEIARSWNFSDTLVDAMNPDPATPTGINDSKGYLNNLACFSNKLVNAVCEVTHTNILIDRFGEMFLLDKEEALKLLDASAKAMRELSSTHRRGLASFKISGRIRALEKTVVTGSVRPKITRAFQEDRRGRESFAGECRATPGHGRDGTSWKSVPGKRPLTGLQTKSVDDYVQAINNTLKGKFEFNKFMELMLGGLHKGIGFDRVILMSLTIQPDNMTLVGRFGAGDISGEEVRAFEHHLSDPGHIITQCLIGRQDMVVDADAQKAAPSGIEDMIRGRSLYLLPLFMDDKPAGLLYLDRRAGRQPLSEAQLKAAKVFRDLMVMGIRRKTEEFD